MKSKILLIISILTAFSSVAGAQTDGDYAVPRTQWDQPDLQGVWNFSSDVPMQRPQRYGTQQFLSAEEIEERRAAIMAGRQAACLLYTSPSPRDLSTSRMPSSA